MSLHDSISPVVSQITVIVSLQWDEQQQNTPFKAANPMSV